MQSQPTIHTCLGYLLALLLLVTACTMPSAPSTAPAASDPEALLTVVATYSILGDLVANVGGEHVNLITLVGPDGDAHTFEPTPADSVALTQASLIFENGLEFETWLDDLYTAANTTAERIVVTEGLQPLAMDEGTAPEDHADEADEHGHHHGEFDPHVWHDVTYTMAMVEHIRDALSAADPENAADYAANADAYLAQLAELDGWVTTQIESIPLERRKLVTSHDTFGYFAQRYGLEIVGSALGSFSTEAADPSAGELAALIETIQAEGVPALFAENVSNPDLIERIAQETGITIGEPLYTDALGEDGTDGATYLDMVRHNVNAFVAALSE
ncbi:MAG: zinc ABC transporter substrate-binding protein [Caldilineaceae bacterium]